MSVPILLLAMFFGIQLFGIPIFAAIGISVGACVMTGQIFDFSTIISGLFNSADSFPLLAVPFFILAGECMVAGGISKRMVDFSKSLVGHLPGGLGMVTIVACMFFAALSGSGVATCAAIGGFMIPAMMKEGYHGGYASALSATSSAVGPIIPPSIPFILYGIICSASITDLFMAGVMPGLLIGALLMFTNYMLARRRHYPTHEKASWRERLHQLNLAKWSLAVPVIILGGIYGGVFSPTEAAIVATDVALIVGVFVHKEIKLKDLPVIFFRAVKTTGVSLSLLGFALVFGRVLVMVSIPTIISNAIVSMTESKFVVLLLVNLILLVVGCLMETSSAVMICSPVLWAIVKPFGVDVVHFGIILTSNLCIGLATPPVGQSLFVAAGISKVPVSKTAKPMIPLLIAAFAAQMIITYWEGFVMFLPRLLSQ